MVDLGVGVVLWRIRIGDVDAVSDSVLEMMILDTSIPVVVFVIAIVGMM